MIEAATIAGSIYRDIEIIYSGSHIRLIQDRSEMLINEDDMQYLVDLLGDTFDGKLNDPKLNALPNFNLYSLNKYLAVLCNPDGDNEINIEDIAGRSLIEELTNRGLVK